MLCTGSVPPTIPHLTVLGAPSAPAAPRVTLRRYWTIGALHGETIPILASRDIEETTVFYERLGFRVRGLYEDFGPAYLIVRRDDVELHFVHSPDADPAESQGGCYLRLVDAQAVYDEWEPLGIPEIRAPQDTPWGMREFFLIDPSGNLLRIGTRLEQ